ncbi:MAG TPA: ParB/Srx family N-terminal domain-containing protein [Blastocatellia bacterium]|nr:ParB/Srx family N-terminal domain-containing protein [Blastocatellia bacterium]
MSRGVLAYCGSSLAASELINPALLALEDFVLYSQFRQEYVANYVGQDGVVVKSSRFHPAVVPNIAEGTWAVDDELGPYGHEIAVYLHLDPFSLVYTEDPRQRFDDVLRYEEWRKQGLLPPPITVVEAERGALTITNGHRRTEASRRSNLPVPAWVWPAATIPGIATPDGRPILAGLTCELAAFWSYRAGLPCEPGVLERIPNTTELAAKIRRMGEAECERFKVAPLSTAA